MKFENFRKRYFPRPNANYKCADNIHCKYGPTIQGKCGKSLENLPISEYCEPKYESRKFWLIISFLLGLATFVLMMVIFSGILGHNVLSPGPLSANHASIENCEQCHIKPNENLSFPILHDVFTLKLGDDNKSCLSCHDVGENYKNPHNKEQFDLAKHGIFLKERPWYRRWFGYIFGATELQESPGDCAECHRGHGKTSFTDRTDNNEVCTQCHLINITDFENTHPNFLNFPFKRRGRIIFDHARHFEKFANLNPALGEAPNDCQFCHVINNTQDGNKSDMTTKSFEQTCGLSCHIATVTGQDAPGIKPIEVIALPIIDTNAFANNNVIIGAYPILERGKNWFNPMVDYLLTSQIELSEIMNKYRATGLNDLSKVSKADLQEIAKLIWAYKLLLLDITDGNDENNKKLTLSIPRDLSNQFIVRYFGGQFRDEIIKYHENRPIHNAFNPVKSFESLYPKQNWTLDRNGIVYRPISHQDEFIKNWIDTTINYFKTPLLQPSFDRINELFHNRQVVGGCLNCHSQEQINIKDKKSEIENNAMKILMTNWVINPPEKNQLKYTKFKHKPHYEILGDGACLACHQLNEVSNYYEEFHDLSITKPDRNFHVISKDTCDLCHVKNGASTDCKTCHLYHGKSINATKNTINIDGVNIVKPESENGETND